VPDLLYLGHVLSIVSTFMTNSASVAAPVAALNLEKATAGDRVRWAAESFGDRLVMTTSFGIQSAVMLHLVTRTIPEIPVVFIDTGYLFPETYRFAEQLTSRLKLNLRVFNPAMTAARRRRFTAGMGTGIKGSNATISSTRSNRWSGQSRELGAVAWLTGLRRAQASTRRHLKVAHQQKQDHQGASHRRLGRPPGLRLSEGKRPALSSALGTGLRLGGRLAQHLETFCRDTEEETRFGGLKRECGLHEGTGRADYQI